MSEGPDRENRHQRRMQRKKEIIDQKIREAETTRGLLLVHTGNGKGKSSAAFGMLARTLGHGGCAGVIQFVKGRGDTGEERFFSSLPGVQFHVMGDGFTWETQNRQQDIDSANRAWEQARQLLADSRLDLVILDELNIVLKLGYLELERVLDDLSQRAEGQHVVVTGRGAPQRLIELADTVTEMGLVKHAFQSGIKAQPGIEY